MRTLKIAVLPALMIATLACGYGSKTYPPVAGLSPAITQLSPNNAAAGSSFTLTVNGSKFASNAAVYWGTTAQTTRYVSAGQLTVSIPGTLIPSAGTVQVTVTNPATPGSPGYPGTSAETSNAMTFTVK